MAEVVVICLFKGDLLVTDEFTGYLEGAYCTACSQSITCFVAFFMLRTYETVYMTCIYLLETDKYNFLQKLHGCGYFLQSILFLLDGGVLPRRSIRYVKRISPPQNKSLGIKFEGRHLDLAYDSHHMVHFLYSSIRFPSCRLDGGIFIL